MKACFKHKLTLSLTEYVDKYASPEYVDRMEVTSGGQVSHHVEDNDDESSMSSGESSDKTPFSPYGRNLLLFLVNWELIIYKSWDISETLSRPSYDCNYGN